RHRAHHRPGHSDGPHHRTHHQRPHARGAAVAEGGACVTTPKLYSVAQVAEALSIDAEAVIRHVRAGRLRAVNVGLGTQRPRYRISTEALDEFLDARQVRPNTAAARP